MSIPTCFFPLNLESVMRQFSLMCATRNPTPGVGRAPIPSSLFFPVVSAHPKPVQIMFVTPGRLAFSNVGSAKILQRGNQKTHADLV